MLDSDRPFSAQCRTSGIDDCAEYVITRDAGGDAVDLTCITGDHVWPWGSDYCQCGQFIVYDGEDEPTALY